MSDKRYGATPDEWAHFDLILGLGPDLLPTVANPNATISPNSVLKSPGKVPSRYNRRRQAAGIKDWAQYVATDDDIDTWSREPDYGICVNTRRVRAIDVDVSDEQLAEEIHAEIERLVLHPLPKRYRRGSSKFLCAFTMSDGDYAKRTIKTRAGIIEFLATGQQFMAIGQHPGGERYEWAGGLPLDIPALTPAEFEALWGSLTEKFAIEPSTTGETTSRHEKLSDAIANDETAAKLHDLGMVLREERDGRLYIECPFKDGHERESDDSATVYFPANTGGYAMGHFKCLHSPCEGHTDREFLAAIGIEEDPRDDFSAVPEEFQEVVSDNSKKKFAFIDEEQFSHGEDPEWIVKGVIPQAEVVVIYGEPGSGKSFFALDIAAAIARGIDWRENRTARGRVGYIAAEGAGGFRKRLKAYKMHHKVNGLDIKVLPAAPSFLEGKDVIALGNAMRDAGPMSVLIVDTMAQVSSGGDENSSEDMGLVLSHCRTLHAVTGATIILIHHSGKDASRGARGWSGINGAADTVIEIMREEDNRTATITKMKDGEDGARFGFRLNTISIGMDSDGDTITSCVVEPCEAVTRKAKEKRLGANEERVWLAAVEMQNLDGSLPGKDAVVQKAVDETPLVDGKRDQRRNHMERALHALIERGKINIVNGGVAIVN